MKRALLFLTLLPITALAEPLPPINIHNVISAVGPSWNTAGSYKAVLVREEEDAALYIFRDPFDLTPIIYLPHAATTGPYWGMVPWLEFDEGGTLLLHSENRAFGRNKWEATLSIIERNGEFSVSAYSLSSYDSLDPDNFTDCTIDMLAQIMTVNAATILPFPLPAKVELANWTEYHEGLCYSMPEN